MVKSNNAQDLATSNENQIIFIGNSITENWEKLDPDFFANKNYINKGIGGQTTPQILNRFKKDVIDSHPKLVIILAGINDIAQNTGPITLQEISENIFAMAELAKENQIKVILCSVLPALDFPWRKGLLPAKKIITLNEAIKKYANENDIIYLDYYTSMVDKQMGLNEQYTYDGVHPNKTGYQVMEILVQKTIKKAIIY
ncbi:MAG: acylhydrolase [Flavobacteriaceae bacterium]|nr:acylhydrolase [Flavobacteriaceae bacterium]